MSDTSPTNSPAAGVRDYRLSHEAFNQLMEEKNLPLSRLEAGTATVQKPFQVRLDLHYLHDPQTNSGDPRLLYSALEHISVPTHEDRRQATGIHQVPPGLVTIRSPEVGDEPMNQNGHPDASGEAFSPRGLAVVRRGLLFTMVWLWKEAGIAEMEAAHGMASTMNKHGFHRDTLLAMIPSGRVPEQDNPKNEGGSRLRNRFNWLMKHYLEHLQNKQPHGRHEAESWLKQYLSAQLETSAPTPEMPEVPAVMQSDVPMLSGYVQALRALENKENWKLMASAGDFLAHTEAQREARAWAYFFYGCTQNQAGHYWMVPDARELAYYCDYFALSFFDHAMKGYRPPSWEGLKQNLQALTARPFYHFARYHHFRFPELPALKKQWWGTLPGNAEAYRRDLVIAPETGPAPSSSGIAWMMIPKSTPDFARRHLAVADTAAWKDRTVLIPETKSLNPNPKPGKTPPKKAQVSGFLHEWNRMGSSLLELPAGHINYLTPDTRHWKPPIVQTPSLDALGAAAKAPKLLLLWVHMQTLDSYQKSWLHHIASRIRVEKILLLIHYTSGMKGTPHEDKGTQAWKAFVREVFAVSSPRIQPLFQPEGDKPYELIREGRKQAGHYRAEEALMVNLMPRTLQQDDLDPVLRMFHNVLVYDDFQRYTFYNL